MFSPHVKSSFDDTNEVVKNEVLGLKERKEEW